MPVIPNPLYLNAPVGMASRGAAEKAAAKKLLADLILGYTNSYPELAASVMPIFKDKKASVVYDRKGVYIMSGGKVARLDFAKLSRMTPAATTIPQNKIAPALEAALLIAENVQVWYNVYQVWNNNHSSENSNDGSSMNPQDAHDIQNSVQRMRPAR